MYAAQNGSLAALQLLLDANAQVMARDEEKLTPLHFAAASGEHEVVRLLLSHKAQTDAVDEEGRRPIDYVSDDNLCTRLERELWEKLLGCRAATDPGVLAAVTAIEGGA